MLQELDVQTITITPAASQAVQSILAERKRPKHLRVAAYRNQWRIYQMHWREITLKDKLLTIRYEIARTVLFMLAYL